MKYLIPICLLLASCGASHKLKQSFKKTVDSSATSVRDTTHVTREENSSSNLTAQDVQVTVTFPAEEQSQAAAAIQDAQQKPADRSSISPPKKTGNKVIDAIQDAITAAGSSGRRPASVQIHIGSISDNSTRQIKTDSGAGHAKDKAKVSTTVSQNSKEKESEGIPLSVRVGIWAILILIVLVLIYRYREKFADLKKAIFNILNIKS